MNPKYKLLILSFLLLNLYGWISHFENIYGIPSVSKYILAVVVIGTIIWYRISNPSKTKYGALFFTIIVIFVLWSVILLISAGFKFNSFFYLQRLLGQPYFIIPYLLPLFLLFSKFDLEFISAYFKYTFLLLIPAFLIQLFVFLTGISTDWSGQVSNIKLFDIGSSFLVLTAQMSKKRYIFYIAFFYTILMAYLFAQYGRRGVVIEHILVLFVMIIIRLRSSLLIFNDRVKIYIAVFLIVILFPLFGNFLTSSYAFERGFSKDSFEESRGFAIEAFFYDFNSASDWIFGRGLDGKILRSLELEETKTYDLIENGFLALMLKGGLLYLIPFLLILLRAGYLGLFRSSNNLVRVIACLIFIYIIVMMGFNVPTFTTKYVFLWISVSICFTPNVRNLSDEQISQAINSRFPDHKRRTLNTER